PLAPTACGPTEHTRATAARSCTLVISSMELSARTCWFLTLEERTRRWWAWAILPVLTVHGCSNSHSTCASSSAYVHNQKAGLRARLFTLMEPSGPSPRPHSPPAFV